MRCVNPKSWRYTAGFTLVEVLVALLILAMTMAAWQMRISSQLENVSYLRDKMLATWVVQNQLHYGLLAQRMEQASSSTSIEVIASGGVEQQAGRAWYWQSQLQQLGNEVTATGANSLVMQIVPITYMASANQAEVISNPQAIITGVVHVPAMP